jgi:SAM-dependent methyltransferase
VTRPAAASAPLLRLLAAVAPGTTVVDAACGDGVHAEPLARLGLDVWACASDDADVDATRRRLAFLPDAARRVTRARPDALGYPDAFAPWAVLGGLAGDALGPALAEAARVVAPGGWLWVEVAPADADAMARAAQAAGLLDASRPEADDARVTVHALYRVPGGVG